jgi:hypothetical protein
MLLASSAMHLLTGSTIRKSQTQDKPLKRAVTTKYLNSSDPDLQGHLNADANPDPEHPIFSLDHFYVPLTNIEHNMSTK